MPTTAGSVALAGSRPPDDAFIAKKLRQAGAVILGKATLTEFANFLTIGMPAGYSSLGGYGFNPYRPAARSAHRPRLAGAALQRRAAGALTRRLELGSRHRRGRKSGDRRHRHRDVRVDPEPGEPERPGRHQADARPGEPRRDRADHRGSGHRRTAGAQCDRRGDPARRDRRLRSARPGDGSLPDAGQLFLRLHAVPGSARAERRAHRRAARSVLERSVDRAAAGDERRDRADAQHGRVRQRPARDLHAGGAQCVPDLHRLRADQLFDRAAVRIQARPRTPTSPRGRAHRCTRWPTSSPTTTRTPAWR